VNYYSKRILAIARKKVNRINNLIMKLLKVGYQVFLIGF